MRAVQVNGEMFDANDWPISQVPIATVYDSCRALVCTNRQEQCRQYLQDLNKIVPGVRRV